MATLREEDVVKAMNDDEKVRYAISKLRLFAKTLLMGIEAIGDDSLDDDGIKSLATPENLLNTLSPKVKDIKGIEGITFEGYLVDTHNNICLKSASEAILELARRIEQTYVYNMVGSISVVPRDYLDASFLYSIAEANLYDLMFMKLLPASIRVKIKDIPKKQVLNISDNGLISVFMADNGELTEEEVDANIADFSDSLYDETEDTEEEN